MSHSASAPEPSVSWQRWFLAALITLTLVLGFVGNYQYERENPPEQHAKQEPAKEGEHSHQAEHRPDISSVAYHTVQFLILHAPHLHGEVNPYIHAGRWLGAFTLFIAGFWAFAQFSRKELKLYWLRWSPWQRGHVIVCGLGDLGSRLALDAHKRKRFVVAIEKSSQTAAIERLRHAGVLVVEGDACEHEILKKVGVGRADFLVASCDSDETNVAIAAIVGQTLDKLGPRSNPLISRLLLRDAGLRQLLMDRKVFESRPGVSQGKQPPTFNYRVNFRDLDLHETAARQALRNYPLDLKPIGSQDKTRVHLVVVGMDSMGQALAIQAARIGHFANSLDEKLRMKITVVDRHAAERLTQLRERYRQINLVCDLAAEDADLASDDLLAKLQSIAEQGAKDNELVTFGICCESHGQVDDQTNLKIGLQLEAKLQHQQAQTLIYQSKRCGFAAIFPTGAINHNRRIGPFGMIEDIYSWDALLHESEDEIARAIHEEYVLHHGGEAWESLSEPMQASNRHAADYTPIKLRALGYHVAPLQADATRIEGFAPDELLQLARLEHRRWCAERWLDDWKHGPETDRAGKINKNLKPWDQLTPTEQKKDYEQIEAIPKILYELGFGIYR